MFPYINVLGLNIPSYGLCMAIAIVLCGFLCINKSVRLGLTFEDTIIIVSASIGLGLLSGGFLYIAVTYSFEDILSFIKNGDFSFVTNSGLVFYGGLLGGVLGALTCSRTLKVKVEIFEICAIPYIPLGHAIGRIGCMMAGCCHGFEYDGIFAIKNSFINSGNRYFPIQAVEALLNILIMLLLLFLIKKEHPKHYILYCYLIMYSIMRFCLEFFRGDKIRGEFMNFSTSQWISIFIFCFCVLAIYLYSKSNKSIRDN